MEKKYLTKIIAKDIEGLKLISACCSGAKIKISDLKFLKKNHIFFFQVGNLQGYLDISTSFAQDPCSVQQFLLLNSTIDRILFVQPNIVFSSDVLDLWNEYIFCHHFFSFLMNI